MSLIKKILSGDGSAPELWKIYQISLLIAAERAEKEKGAEFDPKIMPLLDEKNAGNWQALYEAEQRLLAFASPAEVEADFARRAVEAERLGVVSVAALKDSFDKAGNDAARPALHRCLTEEVQFRYEKRRLDRATRNAIIWHYIRAGAGLTVVCALFLWWVLGKPAADRMLYNVAFVMLIGLCGAYFSRLTSFNSNADLDYDTLMASHRFRNQVLRGGIGMMAAVVMYYLIYSGLIAGDLFPDSTKLNAIASLFGGSNSALGGADPLVPAKDTAKLMVWCFLAGFSERLVTGALERLEESDDIKKGGAA